MYYVTVAILVTMPVGGVHLPPLGTFVKSVTIYVTIISHYYNQRAIVINLGNHLLSHCDVPRLWVCAAADLVAGAGGGEPGGGCGHRGHGRSAAKLIIKEPPHLQETGRRPACWSVCKT
jgi:hypothetical protein